MNESKAMLELADRIERANDVTLDDGRLLPVREQRMIVASLRSSAPQGDGRALERETVAKIIYDAFPFDGTLSHAVKPAWMPGGNSIRQDDARRAADSICALSAPPSVALEAGREAWLRWGLEEIVRCTEPRSGDGNSFICNIANDALVKAGFPLGTAGTKKPDRAALTRPQPGGTVAGTERRCPNCGDPVPVYSSFSYCSTCREMGCPPSHQPSQGE